MLNLEVYRSLIRPLLFSLPPERAQHLAELVLKPWFLWRAVSPALRVHDRRLKVDLAGMKLKTPVGLAAGYDKDCRFLPSLAALGFGYLVGGTVTESPQPGNPRPRLLRHVGEESLINALGFPSKGLDFAARRLERARKALGQTPVIASVAGVTVEEMVRCHRRLEPLADAVEVNISSPNTAGLRVFQEPVALAELLERLNERRSKPLFVKLPPYAASEASSSPGGEARDRVLGLARVCQAQALDGVTVANSQPVQDSRLAVGAGGLSGRAIFPDTLRMVYEIKGEVGDKVAVNACGGIFSGEDAWKAIEAGATTVQVLTGVIYRGPGVAMSINRELLRIIDRQGVASLEPLTPSASSTSIKQRSRPEGSPGNQRG